MYIVDIIVNMSYYDMHACILCLLLEYTNLFVKFANCFTVILPIPDVVDVILSAAHELLTYILTFQ